MGYRFTPTPDGEELWLSTSPSELSEEKCRGGGVQNKNVYDIRESAAAREIASGAPSNRGWHEADK
jgi:hypothetical protein